MQKLNQDIGEIKAILNILKKNITPNNYAHELYSDEFNKVSLDQLNKSLTIIKDIYQKRIRRDTILLLVL